MERLFERFDSGRRFSPSTLLSFTELSPKVRHHLVDVYRKLFAGVMVACVGVMTSMYFQVAAPLLTAFVAVGALMYMMSLPLSRENHTTRLAAYAAFTFFKGMSIGPLVDMALMVDPSVVATAVAATGAVFLAFSVVALTARRREYLYLGGVLASATSVIFFLGLFNLLFGSTLVFDVTLWGGLLLFVGWVVVDTQIIIEKAAQSAQPDALAHAAELFVDLVAIFVRVLIILLRNNNKRNRD
eukprot:TRINITY_DN24594_c0_g1_i1.p1 TRINITY_DN24594_c0_g1~~TRINITY_DN24594_c0_g1_i1.p1  ORF type:complete len:242 (-),score=56.09 TRINITY_DN24594_c0_g1_i1:449-1174(-)